MGIEAAIREARRIIGEDRPTSVLTSIALDPAYAPGQDARIRRAHIARRSFECCAVAELEISSERTLSEVSPPFDPSGGTALAAANISFSNSSVCWPRPVANEKN